MATIHFTDTTTSAPEQFVAALTNSGPREGLGQLLPTRTADTCRFARTCGG